MENYIFKDRDAEFANRKKIVIKSQTPNEIIADIENCDVNVEETGTPVTAAIFNSWNADVENTKTIVNTANSNSESAIQTATSASGVASAAQTIAQDALCLQFSPAMPNG